VNIGERLAAEEPSSREGATAYFAIAPATIARSGLETVAGWAEIGRETLKVSRRLGSQFLQASAPLLATIPDPILSRLRAWAAHGSALLGTKGWKGEFLAVSYFDAAPAALPVLNEEEMAAWAKLGLLVQDAGRGPFTPHFRTGSPNSPERNAYACSQVAKKQRAYRQKQPPRFFLSYPQHSFLFPHSSAPSFYACLPQWFVPTQHLFPRCSPSWGRW
jgi:hypothetical protein